MDSCFVERYCFVLYKTLKEMNKFLYLKPNFELQESRHQLCCSPIIFIR